jgi:sulfide:quinone oxidoreductase
MDSMCPAGNPSLATEPGVEPADRRPLGSERDGFSVLIAGGGVAALEAVLALRESGSDAAIQLISPDREFSLRQLSTGQPFSAARLRTLELPDFCARNGVTLRSDRLAEVWDGGRRVLLDSAEEVPYDALLVCPGARPYEALPGAQVFRGPGDVDWFAELLDRLEHGHLRRLTFAVPATVRWSLPIYELALMTGRMMRERGIGTAELTLVTHEASPLADLGEEPGARIASLLAEARVELIASRAPSRVDGEVLLLEDGGRVETSEVVALPGLRVPDIPGLPQGRNGFIATDATMRVDGLEAVWAAGDATWFPIKQGGIAAQQADIAAAGIALASGAEVEVPPLRPVVRVAMLTGEQPEFFRSEFATDAKPATGGAPLWWPPGKVAGRWLAPYLAREWSGSAIDPLVPLEDLGGDDEAREGQHRDALELALRFAEVDASQGEFEQALRWLDVAEKLNVTLPPEYVSRRADWLEILRSRTG